MRRILSVPRGTLVNHDHDSPKVRRFYSAASHPRLSVIALCVKSKTFFIDTNLQQRHSTPEIGEPANKLCLFVKSKGSANLLLKVLADPIKAARTYYTKDRQDVSNRDLCFTENAQNKKTYFFGRDRVLKMLFASN